MAAKRKKAVRKAEGIENGDNVWVRLELIDLAAS